MRLVKRYNGEPLLRSPAWNALRYIGNGTVSVINKTTQFTFFDGLPLHVQLLTQFLVQVSLKFFAVNVLDWDFCKINFHNYLMFLNVIYKRIVNAYILCRRITNPTKRLCSLLPRFLARLDL